MENTAETFLKYSMTALYRLTILVHIIFDAASNNLEHMYRDSILLIHRKYFYILSWDNNVMCNEITDQNKHIAPYLAWFDHVFQKMLKNNRFPHI